jgi:hypothetical protein
MQTIWMSVKTSLETFENIFNLYYQPFGGSKLGMKKIVKSQPIKKKINKCARSKDTPFYPLYTTYYIIQHITWPREHLSIKSNSHYIKVCWLTMNVCVNDVKICRFIYAFQSFGVYRVNVLISEILLMSVQIISLCWNNYFTT